ncbi:hypothetical protein CPB97_004488 [Podila verticillata]|nr:hypothetical protein CPB97_004488 [Podila verticillata]
MASLIVQYLTRKDIVNCMCVCREWEVLFTPCLWSDVSLEELVPSLRPSQPARHKRPPYLWHSQSIRRLSIHYQTLTRVMNNEAQYALNEFRSIEELSLQTGNDDPTSTTPMDVVIFRKVWRPAIVTILKNFNIRRISMGFMNGMYMLGFLVGPASLPDLEHFEAFELKVDGPELHYMLLQMSKNPWCPWPKRECIPKSGLQSLKLLLGGLVEASSLVGNVMGLYPCLTRLELTGINGLAWGGQCELICRFPNLVYLDWSYILAVSEPASQPGRDVASKVLAHCPRIKAMTFYYAGMIVESGEAKSVCQMSDTDHVPVIQALRDDLEVLRLQHTTFGAHSFCVLRFRVFFITTLRELNLQDCESFSGIMALDCLESCPGLIKFVAPTIAADELLRRAGKGNDTKSWACRGLQYLKTHFSGMLSTDPPRPGAAKEHKARQQEAFRQHRVVFTRLGELTWIKELLVGYPGYNGLLDEDLRTIRKVENNQLCWTGKDLKGELMFNLVAGLGNLTGLKRLQSLDLGGLCQNLVLEDAQWMKVNWPFLEEIKGTMHSSTALHDTFMKIATGNKY